jgi:hypothetical protein
MHIVLHDVAEVNAAACLPLMDALTARLGSAWSVAVTVCWHGHPVAAEDAVTRAIRSSGVEVLVHGWLHHNPARTPLAWLTKGSDEFSGLTRDAAIRRGRWAREALETVIDKPVWGFVPPAWQWGRLDRAALAEAGYRFGVGWSSWSWVDGRRWALATYSWDGGRWRWLGRVLEQAGQVRAWLTPGAVPCVVLHPVDLVRGFLPAALRVIEALLARGHRPARFAAHA